MYRLFFALLVCASVGCSGADSQPKKETVSLKSVSSEQWDRLASRTFYFGHQSVGQDLIDGVKKVLAANPQIKLAVNDGFLGEGPGFQHYYVGKNEDPVSKNVSFVSTMKQNRAPNPVMMFKYCYIDVNRNTNIDELFQLYVRSIEEVRQAQPGATIVHITMPVRVSEPEWRYRVNRMRGIFTQRELNAKRNRFNELLFAKYQGKDPIFDLAEIESTRADGSREVAKVDGKPVYSLAPEWSYDGKHLNEQGSVRAAEHFLVFLAGLPRPKEPVVTASTR